MLFLQKSYQRRSLLLVFFVLIMVMALLMTRLGYLMLFKADEYGARAKEVQQRERRIKAKRGEIRDRKGKVLAGNKVVATISVIHSQLKEADKVVEVLSKELAIDKAVIRKKVEKVSMREKIKSNVEQKIADRIRNYDLDGVIVDEDDKRQYLYGSLASKVLGFTGADNQGIVGLEITYEKYLKGLDGAILTTTTAQGTEIENGSEERVEPVAGMNLTTSLDLVAMEYADQLANTIREEKKAKSVDIILMNPNNGEIYAMACAPEFDLNKPFELVGDSTLSEKEKQNARNQMWRNECVADTYEPGSTFKILTAAAGLEEKVVTMKDHFFCPGYRIVEDRRIRCHKTTGHGSETFLEGIMNSCNPVFMDVGARIGVDKFFKEMERFQLFEKTGIDIPGEATTIFHKKKNVGPVELATMSFGQSFQVTPIRLLSCASAIINGGKSITPHFGVSVSNEDGSYVKKLSYKNGEQVVNEQTSKQLREALGKVVSEGTGKNAAVIGYEVGAKTGTSQKLPRGNGKYIASTLAFAPVNNPQVIALVRIDEPEGLYYGGTVAAPVMSELLTNLLPYLLS